MKFAKPTQMLLGARQGRPVSDIQSSNQLKPHHHKKPSSLGWDGRAGIEKEKNTQPFVFHPADFMSW